MIRNLKRILIGRPLKNDKLDDEKFAIKWGLPILASDAISSVAYAGQEMLLVLLPVIAILAYKYVIGVSIGIICLLTLLILSYRQTIDEYPNGGGAYMVAKENIGTMAGIIAGSALAIDYVMTVAVSISSGVEQLTSAFMFLRQYKIPICVILVILLMIGNLRGIRESSKIFGLPTYFFVGGMFLMIVIGFVKYVNGSITTIYAANHYVANSVGPITLFLVLKAFANGCSALTGIEAVSNAVPNFKEPATKHAKKVLILLGGLILLLFGGTSVLINLYKPIIGEGGQTVLIQLADKIFGTTTFLGSAIFYYITGTLLLILILAANTAFSGFPMLISVMANDGFVPKQLKVRGDRLSYSNGIIILTCFATLLIVIFKADVTNLIGLYSIGVFISFTLSQSGMFLRWKRKKTKHWQIKAMINGTGAIITFIAVIVVAIAKFTEGAWIVVFVIPCMVFLMLKVKKHYFAISKQLSDVNIDKGTYRNRVIVPIQSVNKSSIRALRYAKTISENITAFCVVIDKNSVDKITKEFEELNMKIPLVIKYSPFRRVVDPLIKYIESSEYDYQSGDIITIILPQFIVKRWWHKALHNGTRIYIEKQLLKHKHIVVATMPLQMKRDEDAINSKKYNPNNEKPW